jgi:hypothetical protein
MRHATRPLAIVIALLLVSAGGMRAAGGQAAGAAPPRASAVLVVTLDGVRWQEFFGGADRSLFGKDAEKPEPSAAMKRFLRDSPESARAAFMPFVWEVVARQGQVFGDPSRTSLSHVANGLWFSYPGYAEMLSGIVDARIDSNDRVPNPNVTVFEWLSRQPGFAGRVEAFGSWDLLPWILNVDRSKLPAGNGYPPVPHPATPVERTINAIADDLPPYWDGVPFDATTMQAAFECLRSRRPRVLYVMLGETDEWAHGGRYDLYLDAAWRGDRFIRRLWDMAQAMPGYRGRTALLVTTDHGRGATAADWTDHGRKVPAAERTWMAVMGPGVGPLGVREGVTVTTGQVAATVAALLGQDFHKAIPATAPPLPIF